MFMNAPPRGLVSPPPPTRSYMTVSEMRRRYVIYTPTHPTFRLGTAFIFNRCVQQDGSCERDRAARVAASTSRTDDGAPTLHSNQPCTRTKVSAQCVSTTRNDSCASVDSMSGGLADGSACQGHDAPSTPSGTPHAFPLYFPPPVQTEDINERPHDQPR